MVKKNWSKKYRFEKLRYKTMKVQQNFGYKRKSDFENFWQEKGWPKKYSGQKKFGPKKFGPEKLRPPKNWAQKVWSKSGQ